jgi:hypothetical protein
LELRGEAGPARDEQREGEHEGGRPGPHRVDVRRELEERVLHHLQLLAGTEHLEHRQKDDAQEVDEADRGGHLLAEGSREHWVHSGEALARAARGDGAQR